MRKDLSHLEQYRYMTVDMINTGRIHVKGDDFGCFMYRLNARESLFMIWGNSEDWEHVSVSVRGPAKRCPTWDEMCIVKDLFWDKDEVAVQFHPKETDYVNYHPHCLHLFRPINQAVPTPPPIMVGPLTHTKEKQHA